MANKITIDIEVNGKMQKATVSASKLRAALDGVDEASNRVGKSARETDRNIKGTANASSNAAKTFQKCSKEWAVLLSIRISCRIFVCCFCCI